MPRWMLHRSLVRVIVALALLVALPPTARGQGEATRLHILIVIDTDSTSSDGRPDRERRIVNRDRVQTTLRKAMQKHSLPYTLQLLQGAEATPKQVLSYYQKLRTTPSEALLFFYNGHGGLTRPKGQSYGMERGRLYRSELRAAMLKHKPRLAVILTDCCSDGIKPGTTLPAEGPAVPQLPMARVRGSGSLARDLFFRNQGLVIITGATAGKLAYGDSQAGNHFTNAFCALLLAPTQRFDYNRDGFVEWREFFPHLRNETSRAARSKNIVQTPQAFFLGRALQQG